MQRLSEVISDPIQHIPTGPWDKCFGVNYVTKQAGIARTSVNLIGGVPGAGKSTLSLQLANNIAGIQKRDVCYIAAEETLPEVQDRGRRIQLEHMYYIQTISALGGIQGELGALLLNAKPCAIILDSLPGLSLDTPDASVEYCKILKTYAFELDCPIIIIDHATKQDDLAGLMALQHAVDATMVMYVEPDETRTLSTLKNRNGPSGVEIHMIMTETNGLIGIPGKEEEEENE